MLPGSTQAYDGTPFQYGGEVKNYIKGLLLKRPDDAVVDPARHPVSEQWQVKLARQAFEQALRLNHNAIEALYGLGEIQQVLGTRTKPSDAIARSSNWPATIATWRRNCVG